MKGTTI